MDTPTPVYSLSILSARQWLRGFALAVPLTFAAPSFAASEPSLITGEKKSFGYSWQQELQLGAEADKEISETMGLYPDQNLQAYVEAVGQRVLQQSNFTSPSAPAIYRNTKFTFRVMDSPVVNAFALPGGYVYVTRGLLSHVQNEAQLAVVLGHEIAHVAARHSSQQARRSQWTQLGVIAGAILGSTVMGEKGADLAPTLLNLGSKAGEMFLLRYSREAEHESDNLGVNYATRAGYAAEQSARFFQSLQRLSAAEGKTLPTWQSSHPDPGDRAQRVVKIAGQVPAETRANIGEDELLKHIDGIVVGEDPRQGMVRNGVFYHPGLRFQLPVAQGWKLDNQHAAVIMAEPNGQAMMGLRLASGARARDAAMQFAQQSKVQVVTSGDTVVNGLPTTVIIGEAKLEEGAVGVWNAFIEYDGKVYSLLGYAPQTVFERMRPTFESVAAGFSPLRDQSMSGVQPARLKLVRADRNAPFASFVPTALPAGVTADELAIMNQVSLNEPINEGRILKIPDAQPAQYSAQGVAQSGYPDQRTTYPSQQPAGYPQTTQPQPSGYPQPAQTYPPQSGSQPTYPTQQPAPGYPPTSYPQQSYPQQGYPQPTYPQQGQNPTTYPSSQPGYPQQPASPYPPSQATYPPQPGPGSPPQAYPQEAPQAGQPYPPQSNYPQFPQPPSATRNRTSNPQPTQPQGPVWPR